MCALNRILEHVRSENEETDSTLEMYRLLKENEIEDIFTNVDIFLSTMVTICGG